MIIFKHLTELVELFNNKKKINIGLIEQYKKNY